MDRMMFDNSMCFQYQSHLTPFLDHEGWACCSLAGLSTEAGNSAPPSTGASGSEAIDLLPAALGEHLTAGPAADPVGLTQVAIVP